jgi:ionotropic glutamate receptor NMDA 3A
VIDYSVPFFYSGVSCLSFNRVRAESVPLTGFLVPFSTHLWFSIFALLLATACAAAVFEWFSPFGLNPWGRQRSKNFTIASAGWALPSLMFGHLIAFKAPKCWPNKASLSLLLLLNHRHGCCLTRIRPDTRNGMLYQIVLSFRIAFSLLSFSE